MLYDDAVAWDFDKDILKILKKLDAPNAFIRKNEEERIIDSLRHMINVNYIKKSEVKLIMLSLNCWNNIVPR